MKSGFVSIIGKPNVGKSTLINALVNEKIAITSSKVQTTRNIIQGVYTDKESQIIFVDTPGIHKPINKLGKILNKKANSMIYDVDLILFVVDVTSRFNDRDEFILNSLKKSKIPVILVLNKIDKITKDQLLLGIDKIKDVYPFAEIIPVSAMEKNNIDHLIKVCKGYLTDNIKYFDDNTKTSNSKSFMISEFVREKILNLTSEEVPHSVTCLTVSYEEKKDLIKVGVDIIVDRQSLKRIIVGANGGMIKNIGTSARIDIEKLLGKQVYLDLFVRVIPKWREKLKYIKELGFDEKE